MRHCTVPLLVCVAVAFASCRAPYVRGYAAYMQTEPSGDVGLAGSAGGTPASANIDVEEDLGLDDSATPYGRLECGGGLVSLSASAFAHDSSGTGTLSAAFGDIPAGVGVTTDLDIANVKGAVVLNLLDLDAFRIGPGLGVDYFDVDMQLSAPSLSAFEQIDVSAPVPMLFLEAEGDVGPVAATVSAGWMDAHLDDVNGRYLDLEAMLRLQPFGSVEVVGGYRWIEVDVDGTADGQDYAADLVLQGWFFGGGLTF